MTDKIIVPPDYLGDGVYARFDGQHIWLWTERLEGRHEIALEPAVFRALTGYARQINYALNARMFPA